MIDMWRKALDEKKVGGAIITNLSKAFDCLSNELLIAKVQTYGFDECALKYIYDYLKGRMQRTYHLNSSQSFQTQASPSHVRNHIHVNKPCLNHA